MAEGSKLLTILCPVYEEEDTVPIFYERLLPVVRALPEGYDYNLVFLDNASEDATRERVRAIIEDNPRVFLISLSRNFGYQRSLECGLRTSDGDVFQIIDVDCEDPPEMILQFLEEHENGHDIVYGLRAQRDEAWLIHQLRKVFYRLTRAFADENFVLDMAEFSLFTREVRDAIIHENNSFPFLRSSIGRVGFSIKGIPYKRQRRVAGETAYNLMMLIRFAVAGLLSSSTILLRFPAFAFPFWLVALLGVAAAGATGEARWPLMLLLALGFGFCGLALTTISIYVARVYKNGLMRANAFINHRRSVLQPHRDGPRYEASHLEASDPQPAAVARVAPAARSLANR